MMQYYAINLTQASVKKSSTGGATLYGGATPYGGGNFSGGATILPFGGGKGGLREILNFENRFFKCQFF